MVKLTRRNVIRIGGAAAAAAVTPLWLQRSAGAQQGSSSVLVCVFMRGAVDGLSMVVPYADNAYYQARKAIAVPRPGKGEGSALKLDGRFGLHPQLAPLMPAFKAKELAFVHAVGSPALTRSHFDAQDNMEAGAINGTVRDGWLSRTMRSAQLKTDGFSAIALGGAAPLSFSGSPDALATRGLKDFRLQGGEHQQRRLHRGFSAMYSGDSDPLRQAGRRALEASQRVRELASDRYRPGNGATYPRGPAGTRLAESAALIKAGLGTRVVHVDLGGWDTHRGQPARLKREFANLAKALAAFRRDLGKRMEHVTLMTVSEFGRTVKQNGTGGTDHGHGTAMMVLGAGVAGGKVHGNWPGLKADQLHEGRDLAVTIDFRTLFTEVATKTLGGNAKTMFPGFTGPQKLGVMT